MQQRQQGRSPAFCTFNAMVNGEETTFLCIKIVLRVGVACGDYDAVPVSYLVYYCRNDACSLFSAKAAVDEVVLHIYNNKYFHEC